MAKVEGGELLTLNVERLTLNDGGGAIFASRRRRGSVEQRFLMSLEKSLAETVRVLESLTTIETEIERANELIAQTLKAGGKLLICGNGGSAAVAQHFLTVMGGRYFKNRRSVPAIALNADGTLISCICNDYGWESAFSRQVEGLGKRGDLVIVISTSGNSANILAALKAAQTMGLKSVALLGRGGGKAKGMATVDVIVPGESGRAAQEAHLFLIHHFCDRIDAEA